MRINFLSSSISRALYVVLVVFQSRALIEIYLGRSCSQCLPHHVIKLLSLNYCEAALIHSIITTSRQRQFSATPERRQGRQVSVSGQWTVNWQT